MNRYIHLYPENNTQQRLRLGAGLKDIHYEPGFTNLLTTFGVEITEAEEMIIPGSSQELIVKPPIAADSTEKFGYAMLDFAYSKARQGAEEIGFFDHTGEEEVVYWPGQPTKRKNKAA